MKTEFVIPDQQGDTVSRELLTLLASENTGLGIKDLAKKLQMSRKETLLLLVALESQGVLIWEFDTRKYRPDLDSLLVLLREEKRLPPQSRRSSTKPPLLAKAA
jgi:DNA-binding IclR family transcriptional regulator